MPPPPLSRDFRERDLRRLVESAVKTCESRGYRGGVFTEDEFALELQARVQDERIRPQQARDVLAALGYVRPAAGTEGCWVYCTTARRGGLGK